MKGAPRGRPRWSVALALGGVLVLGACEAAPRLRPQMSVRPTGERYAPLPETVPVKVYFEGEPQDSYREIGTVTATCPEKHWVGGHEVKGRPVCVDGLRQGARKLGAQAVVDIEIEHHRPSASPDEPWLIMEGVAVRLGR